LNATSERSRADVFRISADEREITLSFGLKRATDPRSGETVLDVSDRIVLSSAAAERLLAVLSHAVRDYEWRFGSLGGEALPPAAPLQGPCSTRTLPSLTEGMPEEAARVLELVDGLNVGPVLERSFKMFARTLLPYRFLWGFKRDSLTEQTAGRLFDICLLLGMPERFVTAFRASLAEANVVFLGFEENGPASRYKAYVEFGDRLAKARAEKGDAPAPVLIYVGFKWDARGPRGASIARYTCYPALTARDMRARIEHAFSGQMSSASSDIARGIVEQAAARVGGGRFLYFETTEDENRRNSFDINLYNARLRLEEVSPWLLRACEHFGIPPETFHLVYAPVRAATFGHVTGGVDREGKDFLSISFGAQ
jgi:uncharacterized protein DUF3467